MMNDTIQYTIRPYDTIWMLAQIFNTTVDSIMALNPGIVPTNLQIGQVITVRPGEGGQFPMEGGQYPGYPGVPYDNQVVGIGEAELRAYMHMLWEQHTKWARFLFQDILSNLPSQEATRERFLRNPYDFAEVFSTFYGDDIAQTFLDLFMAHETIGIEMVEAMHNGDTNAAEDADRRWQDNADEMASFFATANPNWYEEDWDAMLKEHLDLVRGDVNQMMAGNYEESIGTADQVELQALEMADIMAQGLSRQFPEMM